MRGTERLEKRIANFDVKGYYSSSDLLTKVMGDMNNSRRTISLHLVFVCFAFSFLGCASKKTSSVSNETRLAIAADSATGTKVPFMLNNPHNPDPNDVVLVDERPVPTKVPRPVYPEAAGKDRIEGSVWVKVLIGRDGKVWAAEIAQASGKNVGFEASALEAAKKTTWRPAMLTGQPVSLWVTYEIRFQLKN